MTSPASSSNVKKDTPDVPLYKKAMAMPVEEIIKGNTFLLICSDFTEAERSKVEDLIVSMGGKVTSSFSEKYYMMISSPTQGFSPSSQIFHIKVTNLLEAKIKKNILVC